jgi:hypothetical protein
VVPVNSDPSITSDGAGATASVNAAENQTSVTTVTSTDPESDTVTYSISGGADAALFSVDPNSGVLTFNANRDFENPTDSDSNGVYEVIVEASDGNGGTDTQAISVTVTDANDAPELTRNFGGTFSPNINENTTNAGLLTFTDQDGDTPTYSIIGGVDAALFSVDPVTGRLSFNTAPDFENPTDNDGNNQYVFTVRVDDGNGGFDTQDVNVTVQDVNEAPIVDLNDNGTTPDRTYSGSFTEGGPTVAVTGANTTILDVDDTAFAALNIYLGNFTDGASEQITVGTVTLSYGVSGTATTVFGTTTFQVAFDGSSQVTLTNNLGGDMPVSDLQGLLRGITYENTSLNPTAANRTFEFEANDGGLNSNRALSTIQVFAVNSPPVISSDGAGATASVNAAENQNIATTVVASDPEGDTLTYSITGGADAGLFSIDPNSGVLTFNIAPDFEAPTDNNADGIYEVTVNVSDGNGANDAQVISVTVTDTNDAPTITSGGPIKILSAAENQVAVDTVTATDEDGDTLTYSIAGGADAGAFSIDPNSGVLTFSSPRNFENPSDANADGVYAVDVQVSDGSGGTDIQSIFVTITDVNDAPTIVSGPPVNAISVVENQTAVDTVAATDEDGDGLTYSIIGGSDASLFSIGGGSGVLSFNAAPDFENAADINADGIYEVVVQVADGNGGLGTQTVYITVTDVNEAPVIVSNGGGGFAAISADENQLAVTSVSAVDEDRPANVLTYSIVGGADRLAFNMSPAGVLSFNSPKDYETREDANSDGIFEVVVRASDGAGGFDDQAISVSIGDVNEAPTITSSGGVDNVDFGANENQSAVTSFTASDPDLVGNALSYSIVDGADASLFSVTPSGVLTFITPPDFEAFADADANNRYQVTVQVSDGFGGIDTQSLTVIVLDLDETTNVGVGIGGPNTGGPITPTAPEEVDEELRGSGPTDSGPNFGELEISDEELISASRSTEREERENDVASSRERREDDLSLSALLPQLQIADSLLRTPLEAFERSPFNGVQLDLQELNEEAFYQALDKAGQDIGNYNSLLGLKLADIQLGSGVVLTTGIVAWALRGGALASSLLATVPMWQRFDPIVIFVAKGSGVAVTDKSENEIAEKLLAAARA